MLLSSSDSEDVDNFRHLEMKPPKNLKVDSVSQGDSSSYEDIESPKAPPKRKSKTLKKRKEEVNSSNPVIKEKPPKKNKSKKKKDKKSRSNDEIEEDYN